MYNKVIHCKISVLVGRTIDKKSKDRRSTKKRRRRRKGEKQRGGKEAEKINKQDSHFFSDYFYYIEKEDQFQISLAKYKTNLAIFHYPMSG